MGCVGVLGWGGGVLGVRVPVNVPFSAPYKKPPTRRKKHLYFLLTICLEYVRAIMVAEQLIGRYFLSGENGAGEKIPGSGMLIGVFL